MDLAATKMRIRVLVQGYHNAQALFDILHSCLVRWREPQNNRCAHWIEFEFESCAAAERFIHSCFPKLRFTSSELDALDDFGNFRKEL